MGAFYHAPKIGAMKKFKPSIYSEEHQSLKLWLIDKRKESGYTQRELAKKLNVVHSLVGKIEQGERRLDIIEFINYCDGLGANPIEFINFHKSKKA